ncbi:MAG: YggS family pyridoxal phosphate-dependent enzyme [Gammaproteobacteria bacterium]|nr:YggS family pyridoxal phosphate-dependent enzyme [Gammaproteobacteria bacterium]
MLDIKNNLFQIRQKVALLEKEYGLKENSVKILAVSKKQSIEKIQAALACGQIDFGENYLQDALPKIRALTCSNITWHFIGRVQSNKTKHLAKYFAWVQSVDNIEIAELLNKFRPEDLPPLNVCIQINPTHDKNKAGITEKEMLNLAEKILLLPRLKLRGLMTIPEEFPDFTSQYKIFSEVSALFLQLKTELAKTTKTTNQQKYLLDLDTLSMGMSGDFAAAIKAGSTMIRIGTAIFGAREK